MKKYIQSFIYNFAHPIKSQNYYYLRRNGLDSEVEASQRIKRLSLSEVLLLAWPLAFFVALYSIIGVKMGVSIYIPESWEGIISFQKLGQITVFKVLFSFVFFPVWMWIWLKVVTGLMSFTASMLGSDEDIEQGMKDVITGAMSPSILYILPVVGPALVNLLFWVYAGIGIYKNLRFSATKTIFILISPFVLFCLMILFIILVGVSSLSFV